ncbi:MAG TPA: alpha/beta hydrolase [Acidimicrobiales bacterium]
MTSYVTSADGTRIAFDRAGDGPPVILVGGIFCDRQVTRPLAERLADRFSVLNFDRRGRGESDATAPYAVEREIDDLAAVVAEAGGTASVYGHSSGAGLSLRAAAAGLPVDRLVLHEPPYGGDDEESRRAARALAEGIRAALAEDRRADAIQLFFTESGMPPEAVDGMSADPGMQAVAPTMLHDLEIMGDFEGGTIPEDLARSVDVPTLVLAGGASPAFFRVTAVRLAQLLPDAAHAVLDGHDHGAPAEAVAPVVADFLAGRSPAVR